LWLGPAPYRPYNEAYLPFVWRGWWDFGTGALGDMGCHSFDPIFRALKLGHPTSVEASSTLVNKETFPAASMINYEFPARGDMPAVRLRWYDGGLKPRRPDELEEGRRLRSEGILFVGDKGKLLNERLIPESRMKDYGKPPQMLARSPGHFKEWIDACKGGKAARANFDWAGPLTEVVLLGNVALRPELREKLTQTKLYWDGENMKFTNVTEANEYLHRQYRQGWTL
jgi:predicted dehydrogenase